MAVTSLRSTIAAGSSRATSEKLSQGMLFTGKQSLERVDQSFSDLAQRPY